MTNASTSATPAEDLWHVEVGPSDVRVVTLEQMDEAFQQGLINEDTRVWQEGMGGAQRLGELLGLDGDEGGQPDPWAASDESDGVVTSAPSVPAAAAVQPPAYTQPSYPPAAPTYRAATPYAPPAPRYAPSAPPPVDLDAAGWPPVIERAQVAAPAAAPSMPPPPAHVPPSIAPLAFDLDDAALEYPKPRRGKAVLVLGFIGAAAAAAAVFVVKQSGSALPAPAAPPPAPAAQPFKSRAYDPGSTPVKLGEERRQPELTLRSASEQEQDAKEAEATPSPASRKQAAAKRWRPPARKSAKEKPGKAHKYDPLNGSL